MWWRGHTGLSDQASIRRTHTHCVESWTLFLPLYKVITTTKRFREPIVCFFQTFLASHDTHRRPTQVEEDHKTLGQTHSVYRTEVGAIEGNINPQKKREESVAHMVQFYVYTLGLYLASSLRVSFPPLFPSQYSVASPPRAWRDPAVLDGLRGSEHCEAWRAAKAPHAASQCPRASIHLFSQSERTPSARLCSGSH